MFWLALLGVLVLSLVPAGTSLPTTGWDKTNHLLGFAVLSLLARCAYARLGVVGTLVGLLLFGVLIELLQAMTPDRFSEWGDLVANGVGIVVGLVLFQAGRLLVQALR